MQALNNRFGRVKPALYALVLSQLLVISNTVIADVNAPPGFTQNPLMPNNNAAVECAPTPTPFIGGLVFTSKYEGTDDANSVVNPDALDTYLEQTNNMIELQRLLADASNKYLRTGNAQYRNCALAMLATWAKAGAMLSKSTNHTGAAVRKWTLAAIGSAYAKLIFSGAETPAMNPVQKILIENWLARVADLVVTDYTDTPLTKVNNHDYWAAWAVGITATSLDRMDLLAWAHEKFIQAMGQVDAKNGFLPNELKRKSLALSYHHYAIQPLVSLALLLDANGYDVFAPNNRALERLVNATLAATARPQLLADLADAAQQTDKLLSSTGLSWLEPWVMLKPDAVIPFRWQHLRPMTSSRLGGDLTLIYAAKYVEKSSSDLSHPRPPMLNKSDHWLFAGQPVAIFHGHISRASAIICNTLGYRLIHLTET